MSYKIIINAINKPVGVLTFSTIPNKYIGIISITNKYIGELRIND